MVRQRDTKGSALIITITCLMVLVSMVGSMVALTSYHYNFQQKAALQKQAEHLATEVAERFRVETYLSFKSSGLGLDGWLSSMRGNLSGGTTPGCRKEYPKTFNIPMYKQGDTAVQGSVNCSAWVSSMCPDNQDTWIEVMGRASVGKGVVGQVRMRIAFGQPNLFDLCVLTTTTNCMCCHLVINGDVGTLGNFRPGWGSEGNDGGNSGDDSYIYGNLYSSGDFKSGTSTLKYPTKASGDSSFNNYFLTGDNISNLSLVNSSNRYDIKRTNTSSPFELNGLQIYGDPKTTPEKIGDKLPQDTDSDQLRNFPLIDFNDAKKNADGKITTVANPNFNGNATPSTMYVIPMSPTATYTSNKTDVSASGVDKTYDGHLVLIGTESNPIKLEGNIVVSGDVVLKGYFTGQGTIYSGRNVYVAGDIVTINPPTDYQSLPTEAERDAQAIADISNKKDAVRLAAKNSVIMGDYTYKNDGDYTITGIGTTDILPIRDRQNSDFYMSQFNVGSGTTGYFKKDTATAAYPGEELIKKSNGKYYTDAGVEVPSTDVKTVSSGYGRYNYLFSPVVMKADGTTNQWIRDSEYRALMGDMDTKANTAYKQNYTWRGWIGGNDETAVKAVLAQNGFSSTQADNIYHAGSGTTDYGSFAINKDYGSGSNSFTIRTIYQDANGVGGNTSGNKYFITNQIGRVDAYLYATRRIAGKTAGKNLTMTGGMIANEIGILAPGYRWDWWMPNKYKPKSRTSTSSGGSFPGEDALNPEYDTLRGRYGYMTVNYDYRMRNGGQGFPLIRGGKMGKRIFWTYSSSAN